MRKSVAFALTLLIGGVVPAAATMIGFCADLPCCVANASAELALQTAMSDCCNEVACADSPLQDLGFSASKDSLKTFAATVPQSQASLVTPLVSAHRYDDLAPPRSSQQRLSSLSVLLI